MGKSGTWGAPNLPHGRDDFRGRQEPAVKPIDDLSAFVMNRIRYTENEPVIDMVPKFYDQSMGPVAYRYAGHVRTAMVSFRRVVALYVEAMAALDAAEDEDEHNEQGARALGLRQAVAALAMRWSDDPGFQEEWKV